MNSIVPRRAGSLAAYVVMALSVWSAAFAQSPAGGATPGAFSVGANGSAAYSIAIAVPPGVAGMEPKLSIAFSSDAGNGLLGPGWGLAGLSAISRCPRTPAQDGVRGAVTYTMSDRYCLDGQRLIAVNGADGEHGTEYRTEIESFTRVISSRDADSGSGPSTFIAKTKSGLTLEFGGTADSRVEVIGIGRPQNVLWSPGTVRIWALNRIRDIAGNEVTVEYTENTATGEHEPKRFVYARGRNTVEFDYEARPDSMQHRHQGAITTVSRRLKAVRTSVGSVPVREYRLDYEISRVSRRSILQSVVECAGDGSCLAPVFFQRENCCMEFMQGPIGAQLNSHNFGAREEFVKLPADLDGDGKADILLVSTRADGLWVWSVMNRGNRTFEPVSGGPNAIGWLNSGDWSAPVSKLITDINGDGLADLLLVGTGLSGLYVSSFIGRGDGKFDFVPGNAAMGTTKVNDWSWGDPEAYDKLLADVDGDGRPDVILVHAGATGLYAHTLFLNPDGTVRTVVHNHINSADWAGGYQKFVADVNADGKSDLLLVATTGTGAHVYSVIGDGTGRFTEAGLLGGDPNSSGSLVAAGSWQGIDGAQFTKMPVDINGDGKIDIALVLSHEHGLFAGSLLNRGNGKFDYVGGSVDDGGNRINHWNMGPPQTYAMYPGDVNLDGRTDILLLTAGAGGTLAHTLLSRGDGTFEVVPGGVSGAQLSTWNSGDVENYTRFGADVDGDGKTDHLLVHAGPTGLYVFSYPASAGSPDRLSAIVTGLGAHIVIAYAPLTSPSVYAKGRGASWPVVDLQLPAYVVARVSTSNRPAWTRELEAFVETNVSYRYGGLRASNDGRGILGFEWVETLQEETRLRTRNEYSQSFPFTGLATRSVDYGPLGAILRQTETSFACIDPNTGASCTRAPGQRYLPYAREMLEQRWDLNGAPMPSTKTRTVLDQWGNALEIRVGTSDGFCKVTSNTFAPPNERLWILGRLTRATVKSITPPSPTALECP